MEIISPSFKHYGPIRSFFTIYNFMHKQNQNIYCFIYIYTCCKVIQTKRFMCVTLLSRFATLIFFFTFFAMKFYNAFDFL